MTARHRCSIVIPVHNKAALTGQCLDALLAEPPGVSFETIVVDDASTDSTAELLRGHGDDIRIVSREVERRLRRCLQRRRGGGRRRVPRLPEQRHGPEGRLARHARLLRRRPPAGCSGGSQAPVPERDGPACGRRRSARTDCHATSTSGFPADHPAVNKSRRFQAVTAACMLVRRAAFEQVGRLRQRLSQLARGRRPVPAPRRAAVTRSTTVTRACCTTSNRSRGESARSRRSRTCACSAPAGATGSGRTSSTTTATTGCCGSTIRAPIRCGSRCLPRSRRWRPTVAPTRASGCSMRARARCWTF